MLARKYALSATLAICASLIVSVAPATLPAHADETTPPVASVPAPTPTPSQTTAPTPTPTQTTAPAPAAPAVVVPPKTKAQKARAKAMKAVRAAVAKVKHGQYVRGRSGPNSFDCSGLMVYAYRKIGIKLAHSSRALSTRGKKIAKKNLKVGDLIFYYTPVHHVAMYIGNGKIVHARNPRNDLDITKLSKYPHYRWARRIIKW